MLIARFFSILILLSGLLFTTALLRYGEDFSIPLFWVSFLFSPIVIYIYIKGRVTIKRWMLTPLYFSAFFIVLVGLSYGFRDFSSMVIIEDRLLIDFKQLTARVSLFIYMFIVLIFLNMYKGRFLMFQAKMTMLFFIIAFLYGYYQYFIYRYNFFDPFSFLRNSSSFYYYGGSGWLFSGRSHSFWAEPAFSMIPVLLAFYLSIKIFPKKYCFIFHVFLTGYVILTGSRLVWMAYLFMWLMLILMKVMTKKNIRNINYKKKIWVFIIAFLSSLLMPTLAMFFWDDKSSIGRSSTIISGLMIFADNLLGVGFNKFSTLQQYYYPEGIPFVSQNNVHNFIVSYMYQLGVFGLLWVTVFYIYFFNLKVGSLGAVSFFITLFVMIALTNDQTYMPIFFISVAMVVSIERLKVERFLQGARH